MERTATDEMRADTACQRRKRIILWAAIAVFLLLFSYCIPHVCDDWYFMTPRGRTDTVAYARETADEMYNGVSARWLGNALSVLTANGSATRMLVFTGGMAALVALMSLLAHEGKRRWYAACLPLLLLLLSPAAWFAGNIAWMPAFDNYIVPTVLTLCCVGLMRALFFGRAVRDTVASCALCLLIGFGGQFFAEIAAVYAVLLAAGLNVWSLIAHRKPSFTALCYLVGTVAGGIMLLNAPVNGAIAAAEAGETYQTVAKGFSGMLQMAAVNYRYVAAYALGQNTVPVCCVGAAGAYIAARSDACGRWANRLRYPLVCVLLAAPVYFYFTTRDFSDLLPLHKLFQSAAVATLVDAAVYAAFVLAVAAVLLIYVSSAYHRRFGLFALVSALACAAPLLFAQPLAHRIFAESYVFLCLVALTLISFLAASGASRARACAVVALAATTCLIYLAMFLPNPRVERQKMAFIEREMQNGATTIYMPEFPFEQRLWYPESEVWAHYFYRERGDITFEHIPYDMWCERYYGGD